MRFLRLLTKPTPVLAIGLGVFAVSGSLFLSASNHALSGDKAAATALLEMYFLLTTIGVGVLGGLEQEMTRTISRDLSLGVSPLSTMRGQIRQAAVLGAVTLALVAAFSPFIVDHWLGGHWYMLAALVIGLIGSGVSYVIRGLLSGYQKFQAYSGTLMVEGLSRLLPGIVLVWAGVHQAWVYGLVYASASVFASLAGFIGLRRTLREREPGLAAPADSAALGQAGQADPADPTTVAAGAADSDAAIPADGMSGGTPDGMSDGMADGMSDTTRRAAQNMILLTLATLASQVVLNGVPLGIPPKLIAIGETGQAQALGAAMGLVRLALLVVFPLQAPLLPKLTRSATRGDMALVRRQTGILVACCVGVGLLGTAGSALFGPWLLVNYMATAALSWQLMAALAFGTTFLMTAYLFQSALIALRCHRKVLIAWLVGIAVLVVLLVVPIHPLDAAGLAAVLSPAAVTAVMFVDLVRVTRARSRAAAPGRDGGSPSTDLLEVSTQA